MKTFIVHGHAFVPVRVRIELNAESDTLAMKAANRLLKDAEGSGNKVKDYIVSGSEDFGAAWGFDALDADEKTGKEP